MILDDFLKLWAIIGPLLVAGIGAYWNYRARKNDAEHNQKIKKLELEHDKDIKELQSKINIKEKFVLHRYDDRKKILEDFIMFHDKVVRICINHGDVIEKYNKYEETENEVSDKDYIELNHKFIDAYDEFLTAYTDCMVVLNKIRVAYSHKTALFANEAVEALEKYFKRKVDVNDMLPKYSLFLSSAKTELNQIEIFEDTNDSNIETNI